jgi:hypothetical protein
VICPLQRNGLGNRAASQQDAISTRDVDGERRPPIEAVSVDEYRLPPSADRREFHRVHALVSDTAEKAGSLVELAESLKAAIMPHHEAPQR